MQVQRRRGACEIGNWSQLKPFFRGKAGVNLLVDWDVALHTHNRWSTRGLQANSGKYSIIWAMAFIQYQGVLNWTFLHTLAVA